MEELTGNSISNFKIINKRFEIEWDRVESIEDIKSILQGLQITINLHSDTIPNHLKEVFEKGLIKEIK
jgi:hypothetical protein